MIHGIRTNGKAHGVVNTKESVVCKMLDLAGYNQSVDLRNIKVLEPSSGEGAFAIEIIDRLYHSSRIHKFSFKTALSNIYLCELNTTIANRLKQNVAKHLELIGTSNNSINFIVGDFLQTEIKVKFDLVIGNPPYVRHENIPDDIKIKYQSKFSTFSHRSDIYIPFYEKGLTSLAQDGLLSYVCSNRWLKNQYGKRLRKLISSHYKIELIIDLENADIFEEEVLGYPAVTNFSKKEKQDNPPYFKVDDLTSFLEFNNKSVIAKSLNLASSNWFAYFYTGASHEKNLKSIEQQDFKIGIGVATGRDSIYINKEFKGLIEEELLLPILTSKDIKGEKINWQGNYIINPFDRFGNLIMLEKYPKVRHYFNIHKEELTSRHIAKKNPSKWYRTIDKIHFQLLSKPKVILPDISGNRFIHVDKGNFYPHHNLYYIIGGDYDQMCLMAAILMSNFVYQQLLNNGNKMNGGYPRWQSQNLKKLLLPILTSIPDELKSKLLNAYHANDSNTINKIVNIETISNFTYQEGQTSLFEPQLDYRIKNLGTEH